MNNSNWKNLIFFLCTMNFAVTYVHTDWLMKCATCKCKWNSGKKTGDCKNTSITKIPMDLSSELQVLDVSSNKLTELQNSIFVSANLHNLHKLFIRNCSMKSLGRDSLMGLEILIELDLSYNLLTSLPRGVFGHLVKLRQLMLNNNHLRKIDDGIFRNLKFLHKIELKENLLTHIDSRAFTNLPLLTQIYLDGNKFNVLHREPFENLEKLTGLSMKENPWNCSCDLKSFRDFAFQQNLYTPPTDCYYPKQLRGTLWSDVLTDAFACKPEILYPIAAATASGNIESITINALEDNVTLSCRFHTSPNTIITWSYNKHSLSNYPKRIFIKNISELNEHDSSMEQLTSELTIVGVKKVDEGVYTCVSQNVGGKAEINIVLTVKKNFGDGTFFANNLLFMLCIMAVGLLIASVIIMTVTCCYCRKFKKLTKQDLNNKKQFEGIKLNSFNNVGLSNGGTDFEIQKQHQQQQQEEQPSHQQQQQYQQQQHQASFQHHQQQPTSTSTTVDFSQTTKSDPIIGNDTHEIKCVLLGDKFMLDNGFDKQPDKTNGGVVLSPTRQTFNYEKHDSRLPPDLLPYGPQSLSIQNTSAILENGNNGQSYISYDKPSVLYTDTIVNVNSSLKDLHIYQDCTSTSSSSYAGSNSIQPNKQQQQQQQSYRLSSHNIGTTPSMANNNSNNARHDIPCKPRQSIVRTSPSFSFLSTGYQQQNNFL